MRSLTDPLLLAGIIIVVGFIGSRIWQRRSLPGYYLMRVAFFVLLTGLLLKGGVVPYRPRPLSGSEFSQLFVVLLEITWWLGAAWVAMGFFRAFIVWGRQPRQSKVIQDLLAGLIYLLAIVAIIANVFDLPVQGLLAASGAAAILIGLALQSSLGDVFSGVVLNLERPYRLGDWIMLDDVIQGEVIETNWRATHVLLGSHDVAIVPNSVIAKAKLINCSAPTPNHRVNLRVKLAPTIPPMRACRMLKDVLIGSAQVRQNPEPVVTVRDLSAEALELELSYTLQSIASKDAAQNEIFEHLYSAAAAAGVKFAPRLQGAVATVEDAEPSEQDIPERLIAAIPLFASLSSQERGMLVADMERREFKPGEPIEVTDALGIVSEGVVELSVSENGNRREVGRLGPGDYFGEGCLLTGEALTDQLFALTRVVIYQVSKAAMAPLLNARPGMAAELSKGLASRRLANSIFIGSDMHLERDAKFADRVAHNIKRFFALE